MATLYIKNLLHIQSDFDILIEEVAEMFLEQQNRDIAIYQFETMQFPLHLHNHIEIAICTEGKIHVSCNNQDRILHPGDFMIAFSNNVHEYYDDEIGTGIMLIFNPGISGKMKQKLAEEGLGNFANSFDVIAPMRELINSNTSNPPDFKSYGYLHLIMGFVLDALPAEESASKIDTDLFTQALNYISSNYNQPLSLDFLSKKLGVNPQHLSRVFSAKIPGGYHKYLQRLRIEHAKQLLATTNYSMYEILQEAGFSDQCTFNRTFKKLTGQTPTEFKANL